MPFFGRAREVGIVDGIVGTKAGAGVLFVSDAGGGKSALAQEVAHRHDAVVVSVSPNERMWPHSGLSAVAAGLSGARRTAVDDLLTRGGDWPEHLLAEELSRTLHLIREEPAVLVVDDIDEMDATSITVLSFVFGRLRGTGLTVVATSGALDGRHEFAGMTQTNIDRLSFREAMDLARSVIGPATVRAVLHDVAEFTGGDPGTIVRVRLTPKEASGEEPLPVPLPLVDDVRGRRRRAGRPAADPRVSSVLDLLSVGPVFAYDRLGDVAAQTGVEVDALIDDGLVTVHGELARIADPALRLRHHAALRAEERRLLHARSAEEHAGRYPATALWHRSFAVPAGDRGRLLDAAVDLAHNGEPAAAVEFAERALSGALDDDARTRRLVDLGEALVLQGHDVRGRQYLRRAGATSEPAVRARAALARLRSTAAIDHVVDDGVRKMTRDLFDADGAERLLCEEARLHLRRGDTDAARRCVETAVRWDVASAETGLLILLLAERGIDVPSSGAHDAAAGAADAPMEHTLLSLSVGILREEYADVRQRIRSLLEQTPSPAPLWRDQLLCMLVTTEARGGDPLAAREAVALWRRGWADGRTPDVATVLVLAAAAALDPAGEEPADLVRQGRDLCRREGTPSLLPWFAVIEGGLALGDGRYDDAVTALRAARDAEPNGDPSLLRADADLIEALWLSGRREEAQRELERLEAASLRFPRRWTTLAVARSRAVCRSDSDGAAAFREAEAVARTDDAPIERLRLRASRDRCLSADERPPLRSMTNDPPPRRGLTAQEEEVVALVRQGLRNREIAAHLFISLRTVELRLTGIYRKLNVSSRVHLVAVLHGAPKAPGNIADAQAPVRRSAETVASGGR